MIFYPTLRHFQEEVGNGETLMQSTLTDQPLHLSLLAIQEVIDKG